MATELQQAQLLTARSSPLPLTSNSAAPSSAAAKPVLALAPKLACVSGTIPRLLMAWGCAPARLASQKQTCVTSVPSQADSW